MDGSSCGPTKPLSLAVEQMLLLAGGAFALQTKTNSPNPPQKQNTSLDGRCFVL